MDTNAKRIELTKYAIELVQHKARQLVGKAGYTQSDIADIEQDLIVDLLERLPRFDPAKATYNTFVGRVVERKISNLLRHRRMEIRDHRREAFSLNDVNDGEEEAPPRNAAISQDDHRRRTGNHTRPETERIDMELDLAQVLADLPDDLRKTAEMLMTMPASQVARALGISRSTFYENHLPRLRAAFEAKGLRDYLP